MSTVEIMAPAGSFESLTAAIKAGADSVYFGVQQLNMRARSSVNFTLEDLSSIVSVCKRHGVKSYLALNTLLYDHDLQLMRSLCDHAKKEGVTAVIVADIAAMKYAHSIGLEVHSSTQLNISNIEEVEFFSQFCDVIVLARELTLQQIKYIVDEIERRDIRGPSTRRVGIEVFCHGALCVAISGKCSMSLATDNASANRGACIQNCRKKYRVTDDETGQEFVLDNEYIMSPKDLCTIGFLDKILDAGVSVLKIEGRGRSPEYVQKVVSVYTQAIKSINEGTYAKENIDKWIAELKTVYNRGFWHGGYYLGKKLGEWSGQYGSQATEKKTFVGLITNYYSHKKLARVIIQSGGLSLGDTILITGPTTGVCYQKIESLHDDTGPITKAEKGSDITFPASEKARRGDKLFLISGRNSRG
ncbi:U32 family peptidase [Candidatus Woesearchaeota archaeon]|nr:U32 family peptidase [Candidatus Woesearchaeota archaeon]